MFYRGLYTDLADPPNLSDELGITERELLVVVEHQFHVFCLLSVAHLIICLRHLPAKLMLPSWLVSKASNCSLVKSVRPVELTWARASSKVIPPTAVSIPSTHISVDTHGRSPEPRGIVRSDQTWALSNTYRLLVLLPQPVEVVIGVVGVL